jgi:streptomycin 6-kinase
MPHWAEYWPERDPQQLAADVGERFLAAVDDWRLGDRRPLGGGAVALVCEAMSDGRPVVLKVNPRGHRDEAQLAVEGDALGFWEPTGAVPQLLGTRDAGLTLLMERLVPGTALDETGVGWEERLPVLGGLAARLHAHAPAAGRFVSLSDFVGDWRGALAGEPALLRELEELVQPADDDVLIHADLHGGNALRHGADWKIIDPKAVRGDRHADIWTLLEPEMPSLPGEPGAAPRAAWAWVARYAEAAGMDARRAGAWTRVRAYAEAAWVTDAAWVARLRAMGAALS